jgi:hypothetical protein
MPSAYATKIAEGFSAKVMRELYARSLFDAIVNRDYAGDINQVGSKLNILSFAKLTEKTYSGVNMTADDLTEVNSILNISEYKSFYWKEKTLDKWLSYIKEPKPVVVEQAANERKKNLDTFVLGFYGDVAAGQRLGTDYTTGTVTVDVTTGAVTGSGTTFTSAMVGKGFKAAGHTKWYRVKTYSSATSITIENDSDDEVSAYDGGAITAGSAYVIQANTKVQTAASTIMGHILTLKRMLDDAEVPDEDRVLVVPPIVAALIPQGTNIALSVPAAYDELVKRGYITDLVGFKVFSSARVQGDNTNGWHCLAIQRNWLTFADKVLEVGMEEDLIGNFGAAYKDLYVYGAKVADNRRKFAAEFFCYV